MVRLLLLALTFLSLAGCNSDKTSEDVSINTEGIFTPVSITYEANELRDTYDFGEYLIGSGPEPYTLTVRNNSLFPLTELNLTMDTFESFGFSLQKTEDGKAKFPGKTGTCTQTLLPAQSCTIVLQFETNISKFYEQPINISYLNYVEGASRNITLQVLAGNPASLIFENEITNYFFGEQTGMAKVPVLERDVPQEYSQVIRVINAGDLKARNLTDSNIGLTQTCNSAETKTCPVGLNSAYRMTHNCPTELKNGEFCDLVLYFRPLNQANTPEMKNVRYDSTIKLNYRTSSKGTEAVLNGYTTTNAVNIEAWFETSIDSQVFETTVVVGNRDVRSFRVNNRGYRNGFMRKLVFKDLLGIHLASCVANPLTTPFLECYDNSVTNIKTLEAFPFKLKDKNDCLGAPYDSGKIIPVDQGCQFDIFFQPSTAYQTAKVFSLEIFAEFDSLWRGASTIQENQLHTLTASSLNAAKIIPVSITYNNTSFPSEPFTDNTLVHYNAGRIGLMSPYNNRRRPLSVTFRNTGGVAATLIVGKDGQGHIFPPKETNPSGISIGTWSPNYFINSLINTNNCTEMQPNQSCSIQLSFAPITLFDWNKNAQNMFDVIIPQAGPGNYLDSYKQFIFTYLDGSNYSDTNTTTTVVDSGPKQAEARLKMDLVEKGQLDDYSTKTFGMGTQNVGTGYRREILFSNIGTKDIPYVKYKGTNDLNSLKEGVKVIATNPAKLNSDVLDCSTIFDLYYPRPGDPAESIATINARSHLWDPFPVDKDCLLTLEFFTPKKIWTDRDLESGVSVRKEISRNTYSATNSSLYGWDHGSDNYLNFYFQLEAYDGDVTDPSATGPYATLFGKFMAGKNVLAGSYYRQLAKLIPYGPRPMVSSIIYRPGWTRPDVFKEDGTSHLVSSIVPDAWFFSDYTEQGAAFTGFDPDFFKGILSKNFFPHTMGGLPPLTNYEFVYYMGSIPAGKALNGSMIISNAGDNGAKITSTTINTVLRPAVTATQHFTTSMTGLPPAARLISKTTSVTGNTVAGLATSYSFSGTDAGIYAAELLINYEDGSYDSAGPYMLPIPSTTPPVRTPQIVTRKILVVAEVAPATTPEIKLDIQDYDLSTDDLNPAVETLGAINPATMGYNEGESTVLSLTSIKIPTPARKDSYIKKRFIFYNPSTTTPIEEVKLFFRSAPSSFTKDGVQSPTSYYVCWSGNQVNATLAAVNSGNVDQPMCTGTCGSAPFNLAPEGSCYIELRYQPTGSAASKSVTLTALHKTGTNKYVHRNFNILFTPQNPATIAITNRTPQVIRTTAGTLSSSNIDFGTPYQTTNPMIFTYDAATTGGWNRMLQLNNPTATKASFLKSYQLYYKQFINTGISETALNSVEPVYPTDYTKNVGGVLYALIHQQNYASSSNPRVQVWANQQCLVGDNTGVWFQKGFTGQTCRMIPVLFADINYIRRTLNPSLAVDMDPNYVRVQYYSANRASTGAVTFHFTGGMLPDKAVVLAPTGINFYQEVTATNANSGEVFFRWAEMNPLTPALGPIVGYRVYYASTSSQVGTVFPAANTTFVDTDVNGTGLYQLTHKNLGTNRFMFYRIFPIRQNAAYTQNPNPFGLPSGKYLSDPTVPVLSVIVPNNNYIYHHVGRYLIDKGVHNQNLLTHSQAKTACTTKPRITIIQGPTFVQYSYLMMNIPVWDVIKNRPDSSDYNLSDYPLWLDNSLVNIHTKLLPNPEYNPTSEMDYLYNSLIFYIKKSGCGTNCSGNTAVGNAFGQPNYTSYVESTINFAGARCYIQLP